MCLTSVVSLLLYVIGLAIHGAVSEPLPPSYPFFSSSAVHGGVSEPLPPSYPFFSSSAIHGGESENEQ